MEMPEGWERLNEDIEYPGNVSVEANDLRLAMQLMRELAEALDSEVDHLHREGYGLDATSRSREVLKKFQEWK